MGANGANQLREICKNIYDILSIELISAAQAKEFNNHKLSKNLNKFIDELRLITPFISQDQIMYKEIRKVNEFLKSYKIEKLFL
jgi:histidine ammonia-lyase